MLAKCYSGALNGVEASTVEIEVSSSKGTSSFAIVGLPDTAVKEAKDRVDHVENIAENAHCKIPM